MNETSIWKPVIIGGVLLGVLSSLPVVSIGCCFWAIGGGVLAAYLFVKESPLAVKLGQGVTLGILTGVVGTAVLALFYVSIILMTAGGSGGMAEQLRQVMDQVPGFPPESREAMNELIAREGFLTIVFVGSVFFQLVFNCLLAMLGGALGVALFEKRKPGDSAPGTTEILPPPPPDTDR